MDSPLEDFIFNGIIPLMMVKGVKTRRAKAAILIVSHRRQIKILIVEFQIMQKKKIKLYGGQKNKYQRQTIKIA